MKAKYDMKTNEWVFEGEADELLKLVFQQIQKPTFKTVVKEEKPSDSGLDTKQTIRKDWTDKEDKYVIEQANLGKSRFEIAKNMDRTPAAVSQRISALRKEILEPNTEGEGYMINRHPKLPKKLKYVGRTVWSKDDEENLLYWYEIEKMPFFKIARKLGRTTQATRVKYGKLKKGVNTPNPVPEVRHSVDKERSQSFQEFVNRMFNTNKEDE